MANDKRSLYEINSEILACLEAVDLETGELLEWERLEELQVEKEQKLEGVALYIKDLLGDAAKIKAEEAALGQDPEVETRSGAHG